MDIVFCNARSFCANKIAVYTRDSTYPPPPRGKFHPKHPARKRRTPLKGYYCSGLPVGQLSLALKAAGVPHTGNKATLIRRCLQYAVLTKDTLPAVEPLEISEAFAVLDTALTDKERRELSTTTVKDEGFREHVRHVIVQCKSSVSAAQGLLMPQALSQKAAASGAGAGAEVW